ncbi:hypothetical protein GOC91_03340 [Sinorhizobium medicae]|nr:hypothetical protein [Sinorhizobium medicae]MDX0625266.1 hypothetical protein [Sinorhizobium medicae]MDX0877935.1 hypothetical protein [Sinorhizobium medicae]MDX1224637.1 hypothetical protein [Sinorhizobium medicae]
MTSDSELKRYTTDYRKLPAFYPTHVHGPSFWELLGRTVATFGFLEEVLARAIFAFTATRPYSEDEIEDAFRKWIPALERALSDTLSPLITAYEKAVLDHPDASISNLPDLIEDLRRAAELRNVLCHGSWGPPDANGASIPFFVRKRDTLRFDTPVDDSYLRRTQQHVVELTTAIINSVAHMGWQFPGSSGPGKPVL